MISSFQAVAQEKSSSSVIAINESEDTKPSYDGLLKATQMKSSTDVVDLTSPGKGPGKKASVLDNYSTHAPEEVKPTGDFLSRLGSTTSTIDFNNTTSQAPLFSQNLYAASTSQSRKRKYKLVVKTDQPPEPESTASDPIKLPEDKCELIKIIKQNISKENYKRLLCALKSYSSATEVTDLFSELCIVFKEPSHTYMLRGMRRFVKDQHRVAFDNYLTLNQIQ